LRPQVELLGDWQLTDRFQKLEETYKYMIHYMVEGMADEGRSRLYSSIVDDLLNISDIIEVESKLKTSSSILSSQIRLSRLRGETLSVAADQWQAAWMKYSLAESAGALTHEQRVEMENALDILFNQAAALMTPSKEDLQKLRTLMEDKEEPFILKAQLISALTISTLEFYHIDKLLILADIVDYEGNQKLMARALTGITFILALYADRAGSDKRLAVRFALWEDNLTLYTKVREIVVNILRTIDTERISRRMQQEIIPELMKMQPDIMRKIQGLGKEEAMEAFEENPEWQEIFNKSDLGYKLRELSEMQSEGADLMMASFATMKNFPFFNTMSSWFLPFYPQHSLIAANPVFHKESIRKLLTLDGIMCDSDKYSFANTLARVPEAQREMMASQLDAQMEQISEQISDNNLKKRFPEFATEVSRYIRDLFRFYKLFRKHEDFKNPFATPFPLLEVPYLSSLLDNDEILGIVSEFYFRRGYYEEALKLFNAMEQRNPTDKSTLEKKAYSLQSLHRYEEALDYYTRAELLDDTSQWLLRKLASVSRTLGKYENAAGYYRRALENDQDNISLTLGLGSTLVELGQLKEALNCFYKAEFLKPGRDDIQRAIAWTEFLSGRFDKSETYTLRLLAQNPTANDMMNAGHLYFMMHDYKKSSMYYANALSLFADGDVFDKALESDMSALRTLGADDVELRLIIDHIKYMNS